MAILKDLIVQGVGRIVGKLFLSADPTSDLEAATKHYVDQQATTADSTYVKRSGDTMTGLLTLSAAPTSNLHAATKKYVDDNKAVAATAAPGKVAGSSAQGSSTNYARQDHTHGIDLATGDSNGQVKIAGSNVSVKGLAGAAYVDTESTVANDAKVPTGAAVKSFVEGKGYTTNTGTVTSVSGATGLTGTITGTGTIKADLVSETKLTNAATAATETANRVYPVALDKNGKLAVNVPWEDTNTQTITGVKGSAESTYRTGDVSISAANIGLGNVNNTSDANKPISTATQTALDAKADKTEITTLESSRIHLVKGTQTETTAAWTGNIDVDELYDGLTILYYLPRTSASNATLNLTLADGTTKTGAKEIYVTNTTRMGTHYGAGATILLTYWSAGSILINGTATATDRWTGADYWNSNTIGEYAGACTAGSFGMARYSLIAQVDETHWESLVATSGSGTSKAMNTHGFMLTTMFYQSGGDIASGSNSANGSTWLTGSFDTRYSTNGGSFSAAGRPFYLVGTISGGKFYLKPTTWWADSLPSTDNGYVYWYVGIMYSTYQCTLTSEHPIYKYAGDGWKKFNINGADYKIISLTGNATSSSTYAKYPYQYTIQWPSAKADTWVDGALLSGDYDGDWAVDTANGSVTMYFETNPTATFGLILEDAHIGAITGITDYQTAINMTQTGTYPDTTLLRQLYLNFQNGCSTIANAITAQGVTTASTASPSTMATNIATVAENKYDEGYAEGELSAAYGAVACGYGTNNSTTYTFNPTNYFYIKDTFLEADESNPCVLTVKKDFEAGIIVNARGAYSSSGSSVSARYRIYVNGTVVASKTDVSNAGYTYTHYVNLFAGDTISFSLSASQAVFVSGGITVVAWPIES